MCLRIDPRLSASHHHLHTPPPARQPPLRPAAPRPARALTHSDSSALLAPPLSTRRRWRAPARPPRWEGREPLPPPPVLPLQPPPPRAGEPPLSEPEAPDSSSSVSCEARCRRRSAILRRTAAPSQFLTYARRGGRREAGKLVPACFARGTDRPLLGGGARGAGLARCGTFAGERDYVIGYVRGRGAPSDFFSGSSGRGRSAFG